MHKQTNTLRHAQAQTHKKTHRVHTHQPQAVHFDPEETILVIWYRKNKARERFYLTCIVYPPISYHTPTHLIQPGSDVFFYCHSFFGYPPHSLWVHSHWYRMCTGFIFYNKKEREESNSDQYRYSISSLCPHSIHTYDHMDRERRAFWFNYEQVHSCVNLIYNRKVSDVEDKMQYVTSKRKSLQIISYLGLQSSINAGSHPTSAYKIGWMMNRMINRNKINESMKHHNVFCRSENCYSKVF